MARLVGEAMTVLVELQIEQLEAQARKLKDQSVMAAEAGRDDLPEVARAAPGV